MCIRDRHIGLAFHLACSDAADYDVDVNVSRMVAPIRVDADDGRMTGEHSRPHRNRQHPNTQGGTQALYAEAPRLARVYEALQHGPDPVSYTHLEKVPGFVHDFSESYFATASFIAAQTRSY